MSVDEKFKKENIEKGEKQMQEENELADIKNQNSDAKSRKVKRGPKEKIVDDSINIIDLYLNQNKDEMNTKKLLKIKDRLQKEINKNLEVEMMMKLQFDISSINDQYSSLEENIKKNKFMKVKDDLINLKNYIDLKKSNLKRKCENNEAETPAKKLKNIKKINDNVDDREVMAENHKIANILEKQEDTNKKDNSSSPKRIIKEDEGSTQINKKEDIAIKDIKIQQSNSQNNKQDKSQDKHPTILTFFKKKVTHDSTHSIKSNNLTPLVSIAPVITNSFIEEKLNSTNNSKDFNSLPHKYEIKNEYNRKMFINYLFIESRRIKKDIRDPKKKRKLIYLHDSYSQFVSPKYFNKISNKINPRNPFRKDDLLVDYEKDSEEEYEEENGEDLKSNDGEEEEEEKDDDEEDQKKWIVPDGYLSENEVLDSDKEENVENNDHPNPNYTKNKSLFELMDIRKTYQKPIIINFKSIDQDSKVKNLSNFVKARIFNCGSNAKIIFPIHIKTKSFSNNDTNNNINIHEIFKENIKIIVELIHGNYFKKDEIIQIIHKKVPQLTKNKIDEFFKKYADKSKSENGKKHWILKTEMLEFSQLKIEELNKFKEANQLKYMDKVKEDRPKKIKDKEEVKYYSQNNNETVKILPNTEVKAIKNKNSNSKKSKKLNSNSKQLTIENTKKSNQFQKQSPN